MITIRINQTDIKKTIKLRQILAVQSGDIGETINILGSFVVGENGELLTREQGKEMILDLTIEELEMATKSLYAAVSNAAIPPASATS